VIDGVVITPLKQIHDERGAVLHMLRQDAPHYEGFGEVYFSIVNPGVVKGWKRHKRMTMNLAVPRGRVKLVLVDLRDGSATQGKVQEIFIGEDVDEYCLVTVPPMVWNASQCLGNEPAIVANGASIPHEKEEGEDLPLDTNSIPYTW